MPSSNCMLCNGTGFVTVSEQLTEPPQMEECVFCKASTGDIALDQVQRVLDRNEINPTPVDLEALGRLLMLGKKVDGSLDHLLGPLTGTHAPGDYTEQVEPTPNNYPYIMDLVLKDIEERAELGKQRYRTYLQPFNGRSALRDAYEEILDLACYLRQKLYEETNE